ncbi:MAG TPA: GNAT family N-acetyltransferase [Firmicutes bacterium]|nr:GNAT family N-acetyltransferase [Candidatus Fermentithermobacillaceae bacterium]
MPIVRLAEQADLRDVKSLADCHRKEIGFLPRAAFEESALHQCLIVACDDKGVVGFTRFRHRRDGVTVIYEICSQLSGSGAGGQMIDWLKADCREHGQRSIILKCPSDLPSNRFYESKGFRKVGVEAGKAQPLNIWSLEVS